MACAPQVGKSGQSLTLIMRDLHDSEFSHFLTLRDGPSVLLRMKKWLKKAFILSSEREFASRRVEGRFMQTSPSGEIGRRI